jgi:ComF family protein
MQPNTTDTTSLNQPIRYSQVRPTSGPAAFLLDLLFPPQCVICNRVDTTWCDRCQEAFSKLPIEPIVDNQVTSLTAIAATAYHGGSLQKMIHALKYEQSPQFAMPLAHRLHQCLQMMDWSIDGIVGVPLHPLRQRERGYNQAQLLAQEIAALTGLPEQSALLQRDSFTRPQVGLDHSQRQQNVKDAFSIGPGNIAGQNILIIDDVFTTGATLNACAQALAGGGAAAVYGLTVTAAA